MFSEIPVSDFVGRRGREHPVKGAQPAPARSVHLKGISLAESYLYVPRLPRKANVQSVEASAGSLTHTPGRLP
ncbi:hypothetical protein RRG08_024793 [Elysia crispata]|uniref:Uncharacterized protein n=1 Tax=Elysia crispata TaxID=231223 RepID=A0AAE1CK95_9GAST|nr:hypothetical protein RRG08_024793 [Elysia crispata]